MAAQNGSPQKPVSNLVQYPIVKNVSEATKNIAESASDQIFGNEDSTVDPQLQGDQGFDEIAYREKVDRDEKAKIQQLQARLAQINQEMQQAGYDRQRSQQEYIQAQNEKMQQFDRGGLTEEEFVKKQQEEFVPSAIKARQGTGETGKRKG